MTTRRCSHIAPIGSLLKGAKPAKSKPSPAGRGPRQHDKDHLAAIRKCPCVVCGREPCGVAAHVRMSAPGKPNPGVGAKPHDRYTVPLCDKHHKVQHGMGEAKFWQVTGIDVLALAAALFAASPDQDKMRKRIIVVREKTNQQEKTR